MKNAHVLVIGGGVVGMTTAFELLKAGHTVTIWSKETDGEFPSTSHNAYAMWVPVAAPNDVRVEQWSILSFWFYQKLFDQGVPGVFLRDIFKLRSVRDRQKAWYETPSGYIGMRHPNEREIRPDYEDAHIYIKAPVIDPKVYLPWLRQQLVDSGVEFETREVTDFSDCPFDFDAIINATGLGAATLVRDDTDLHAKHVRVIYARKTPLEMVAYDNDGPNHEACIVPHPGYNKLGAEFDAEEEPTSQVDAITRGILQRCSSIMPGFTASEDDILEVVHAVRPERSWPRLEYTSLSEGRHLIHNYGHSGMGYMLSPGMAMAIAHYLEAI